MRARQDYVWITTEELLRFRKTRFDKMLRKLDSTENPRSFEKYSKLHLKQLFWTFRFFRVDLNPLTKKFTRSYVRNVRIDFRTPFLIWYKIPVWFVFRTYFAFAISVRPRGTCESSRRSARRWTGIKSAPFMVSDLQSPRYLAHPLRNDPV